MIVMKFGGTSVENAAAMNQVLSIVKQKLSKRPVVVASAMAKITDTLLNAAYFARDGRKKEAGDLIYEQVALRHRTVLREVVQDSDRLRTVGEELGVMLNELSTLVHGIAILREASPSSLDAIASYGERMSTLLLVAAMQDQGLSAELVDARNLIITDDNFTRATPQIHESEYCVRRLVEPLLAREVVPVTQGFVGATRCGVTTTLGRGGSDYSGAIIGALLGAEAIEIWTDVDGVMTSDPRVVPTARVLPCITFAEALELSCFGAKVLHPSTVLPAMERNIPVFVFNTKQSQAKGTKITAEVPAGSGEGVRAIAFKKGISVITISSTRMSLAHGFLRAIFEVFEKHRTSVKLVARSDVSASLTIDDASAIDDIVGELSKFADVKVERNRAIICLVGERMKYTRGLTARIFSAVCDIDINMISQGASGISLSFIVAEDQAVPVVTSLHKEMFGV